MIHFITKYDVYKTWDFLAEMTAAKQNVKNVVWNFPPMTALNGIRKRRTPNHQDHRTRKTPGEPRKRETRRTEMLVLASKMLIANQKR
jgi:hypothetical protein